jgi:hypothetical protein
LSEEDVKQCLAEVQRNQETVQASFAICIAKGVKSG